MVTAELTREQACRQLVALIDTSLLDQPDTPDNIGEWLPYAGRKLESLSTGEQFLVHAVWAVWNGHRGAPLAGLLDIDRHRRATVLSVLSDVWRNQ